MRKVLTVHLIFGGVVLFAAGGLFAILLTATHSQWPAPLGVKIFFGALSATAAIGAACIMKGKKV